MGAKGDTMPCRQWWLVESRSERGSLCGGLWTCTPCIRVSRTSTRKIKNGNREGRGKKWREGATKKTAQSCNASPRREHDTLVEAAGSSGRAHLRAACVDSVEGESLSLWPLGFVCLSNVSCEWTTPCLFPPIPLNLNGAHPAAVVFPKRPDRTPALATKITQAHASSQGSRSLSAVCGRGGLPALVRRVGSAEV